MVLYWDLNISMQTDYKIDQNVGMQYVVCIRTQYVVYIRYIGIFCIHHEALKADSVRRNYKYIEHMSQFSIRLKDKSKKNMFTLRFRKHVFASSEME